MSAPSDSMRPLRYAADGDAPNDGRSPIVPIIASLVAAVAVGVAIVAFVLPMFDQREYQYPATRSDTSPVYGSVVGADSLANIIVGGRFDASVSYRFRATQSAGLDRITVYLQDGEGYSAGSGGTLRIEVRADDGSDLHHPSDDVLAAVVDVAPEFGAGSVYMFPDPPALVAGRLYHVVFTNIDPAPQENYVSLNGLFLEGDPTLTQPGFPESEWLGLVERDGADWSSDRGPGNGTITPIMGLSYDNGERGGLGYMEVWARDPRSISGREQVRQVFSVRGEDRKVVRASVRVARVAGDGPLTIRLEDGSGQRIESGAVEGSTIPLSPESEAARSTWVALDFAQPLNLVAGQEYRLVLSAPESTTYSIVAVREGSAYSYGEGTYFADGHAEFDDGSGWRAFHPSWSGPSLEGDLQFTLE